MNAKFNLQESVSNGSGEVFGRNSLRHEVKDPSRILLHQYCVQDGKSGRVSHKSPCKQRSLCFAIICSVRVRVRVIVSVIMAMGVVMVGVMVSIVVRMIMTMVMVMVMVMRVVAVVVVMLDWR
jgi:hypothetical protein